MTRFAIDNEHWIVTAGYGFEDVASKRHDDRDDALADYNERLAAGKRAELYAVRRLTPTK